MDSKWSYPHQIRGRLIIYHLFHTHRSQLWTIRDADFAKKISSQRNLWSSAARSSVGRCITKNVCTSIWPSNIFFRWVQMTILVSTNSYVRVAWLGRSSAPIVDRIVLVGALLASSRNLWNVVLAAVVYNSIRNASRKWIWLKKVLFLSATPILAKNAEKLLPKRATFQNASGATKATTASKMA